MHMLHAFHDKINTTPPLYFVLGWFWSRMFGAEELSLRLFSCLGVGVASVAVWVTLRRTFSFTATSIGVFTAFLTSRVVLAQNSDARMYGLFLAACAFGVLLYDSINRHRTPDGRLLLWNTIVHVAIVNTHLYGLFYSTAILASHVVRDRYFKVLRPAVYMSICLSWLSLVIYAPSFLNQADAGNPRDWLVLPTLRDLIDVLAVSSLSFSTDINTASTHILLILLLILGLAFYRLLCVTTRLNTEGNAGEISVLLLACTFWLVPVFTWFVSHSLKPIFWDRYLLPSLFSRAIFIAYLLSWVTLLLDRRLTATSPGSRFLLAVRQGLPLVVLGFLLVQPILYAVNQPHQDRPGAQDAVHGYQSLPIAMQYSHDFLERFYYAPDRSRYFFILDWEAASGPTGGLFAPQEYKHLEAIKRNYPEKFGGHIITSQEFLERYHRFLALTFRNPDVKCGLEKTFWNGHCARWFAMRILNNPNYYIHDLGDVSGGRKLWLVVTREGFAVNQKER
jgi:hypothetical protein